MVDGWAVVAFAGAGIAVLAATLATAAILWNGLGRGVNLQLSAIVLLDATLTSGLAVALFADFELPGLAERAWVGVILMGLYLLAPLFLLFLGSVLRTPLVTPWRTTWVRLILWAIVVIATGWSVASASQEEPFAVDPEAQLFLLAMVSLYALICCIASYVEAPRTGLRRRQTRAFVIAFGARDALWFSVFVGSQLWLLLNVDVPGYRDIFTSATPLFALMPVASILFSGFLAIGFFRTQMLGIDLRIRKHVAQAFVGIVFLLVIFLVIGITEQWLQRLNIVAAGLVAGLMLFALHPLQRLGERLAAFAFPDAEDLGTLRAGQREQLYREQVEIAWQDGRLALKERQMLDTTRARLGIPPEKALRIESEVTQALRPSKAGGVA